MWGTFLTAHAAQLIAMFVLLCLSGFFSGSETALFSLSRGRLLRLASRGGAGRVAAGLMDRPQRLLNTLLLGNMLVNVSYAGLAAGIVFDMLETPVAAGAFSLGSLLVLILLGEVTPKLLAYAHASAWSKVSAVPLAVMMRVLSPVLWVLEKVLVNPLTRLLAPARAAAGDITSEELAAVLDLSARRGTIDRDLHGLLREILELSDLRVGDIMVPRVDMVAWDAAAGTDGLAERFAQTHLRKIPVYEGDADNILGVVHAKRMILRGQTPLRELVTPVPFVPEAAPVDQALLQFRVKRAQMAIVVDEYGGTAGVVTLEDVLEEVVGEIPDPHEGPSAAAVQQTGPNEYAVDGDLGIHEWGDAFGIDLSEGRISTIGGFVTKLIGRIPVAGDTATYRNLKFTVASMRRRRVDRLDLQLLEHADVHAG